jgi:peptide methionine sulfoxide reductase msrA/msrB
VTYDKEAISLKTLCRLFFISIDPLLKDRQGDDCGTRYRTGIYWTDGSDEPTVNAVYEEVQQEYNQPLAVEKSPLQCFYTAEEYHQQYLIKNPDGYCHLPIELFEFARSISGKGKRQG